MKRHLILMLPLAFFSVCSLGAADSGKIVEVYSHPDGQMAFRLDGGLPGANAENNCGTVDNVWVGVSGNVDSSIKSLILTAKATGSEVSVVSLGSCVGGWIKLEALHIK